MTSQNDLDYWDNVRVREVLATLMIVLIVFPSPKHTIMLVVVKVLKVYVMNFFYLKT